MADATDPDPGIEQTLDRYPDDDLPPPPPPASSPPSPPSHRTRLPTHASAAASAASAASAAASAASASGPDQWTSAAWANRTSSFTTSTFTSLAPPPRAGANFASSVQLRVSPARSRGARDPSYGAHDASFGAVDGERRRRMDEPCMDIETKSFFQGGSSSLRYDEDPVTTVEGCFVEEREAFVKDIVSLQRQLHHKNEERRRIENNASHSKDVLLRELQGLRRKYAQMQTDHEVSKRERAQHESLLEATLSKNVEHRNALERMAAELRRQSRRTEGIAGEAAKQVEAAQAEHERKIKAIRRSHLAEQTSLRKELTKAVGAREAARAEHKAANEATDRTVTKLKADLVEAKSVCRAWTNKIQELEEASQAHLSEQFVVESDLARARTAETTKDHQLDQARERGERLAQELTTLRERFATDVSELRNALHEAKQTQAEAELGLQKESARRQKLELEYEESIEEHRQTSLQLEKEQHDAAAVELAETKAKLDEWRARAELQASMIRESEGNHSEALGRSRAEFETSMVTSAAEVKRRMDTAHQTAIETLRDSMYEERVRELKECNQRHAEELATLKSSLAVCSGT